MLGFQSCSEMWHIFWLEYMCTDYGRKFLGGFGGFVLAYAAWAGWEPSLQCSGRMVWVGTGQYLSKMWSPQLQTLNPSRTRLICKNPCSNPGMLGPTSPQTSKIPVACPQISGLRVSGDMFRVYSWFGESK